MLKMVNINTAAIIGKRYNELESKWDILFDKDAKEWISFQPKIGLHVYTCYACKHMFSSKTAFLDHVNRRSIVLKYTCKACSVETSEKSEGTFYNGCALLLHTRIHYSLDQGEINLSDVEISSLPLGLAGFMPHDAIPMIYDVTDDEIESDTYINPQFYSPEYAERGREIITMKPSNYVYKSKDTEGDTCLLTLKQVSCNIPRCEFVTLEQQQELFELQRQRYIAAQQSNNNECDAQLLLLDNDLCYDLQSNDLIVKAEPDSSGFTIPIISKIESLNELANAEGLYPKCLECKQVQKGAMIEHFLGQNRPLSDDFKCYICKFVAPSTCSLMAHNRIHEGLAPFVCPDCGEDFAEWDLLRRHMEEVCFHLAKQVRYRCPGKKCGKLFALPATFAAHFTSHIQNLVHCSLCKIMFFKDADFREHVLKTHQNSPDCPVEKIYHCTVCTNLRGTLSEATYDSHIEMHTSDTNRCLYVYMCRFCRSYFRSTGTYATHMRKCTKILTQNNNLPPSKKPLEVLRYVTSNCTVCNQKIVYREDNPVATCSSCKKKTKLKPVVNFPKHDNRPIKPNLATKKYICILCNEQLLDAEKVTHMKRCKFAKASVIIKPISREVIEKKLLDQSLLNSNSENQSNKPDGAIKRKRPLSASTNLTIHAKAGKKSRLDLTAEKAIPFDGTYNCKLCKFHSNNRGEFHGHIVVHRDVSTAYQCMECGECFVVKPSLLKHLRHYHNISDCEAYLSENSCFDKLAVKELEDNLKLPPGESKEPVKENQCRVCRREFGDSVELSRHMRVHGMAFLVRNSK